MYLNHCIDRKTAKIVLLHDLATNLKRHIKASIINRRIPLLVLAENIAKCDISLDDGKNGIQLLHFRSKTNQNVISTHEQVNIPFYYFFSRMSDIIDIIIYKYCCDF